MPVSRSAGVIVFKENPEGRKYLLIRSSRDDKTKPACPLTPDLPARKLALQTGRSDGGREFWDIPKEELEKAEDGFMAAKRAAGEETGFSDIEWVENFKETVNYFTKRDGKTIPKFVAVFLARVNSDKVKLSWEHDSYEWLPYEEAYKRVSVPQIKKALEAAERFLK